jgi:hypothetical protein
LPVDQQLFYTRSTTHTTHHQATNNQSTHLYTHHTPYHILYNYNTCYNTLCIINNNSMRRTNTPSVVTGIIFVYVHHTSLSPHNHRHRQSLITTNNKPQIHIIIHLHYTQLCLSTMLFIYYAIIHHTLIEKCMNTFT